MAKKAPTASKRNKPVATRKRKPKVADVVVPEGFVWTKKDLLGLDELSAEEITYLLDTAESFSEVSTRSIKKVPALRGQVVGLLFFENSTRTRMSFELAAARLSADPIIFTSSGSSVSKGETTLDTVKNIEAMGVDIFVMRHGQSGAPHMVARKTSASIINAGDGPHEHPTQALLDIYTIREKLGSIAGKKVAIVGDIAHSRVARSNIIGLQKLGAEVVVVGPPTLIPNAIAQMGCSISHSLDEVLPELDAINMLRIQFERFGGGLFPSIREYHKLYGMNNARLAQCKDDVLIMHPGPMNRGVEITSAVADGPNSTILRQVTNGLAIRMAVLYSVFQAQGLLREQS
ncbi:MAG: aspartate carbamoyltransferase catalytic subunit [Phycisphaerales bacterium]|jgi:aspartate carbamoyltransferase catalytic subunit|nr:aspartate carbamoyltransferase catalytic subunit [Phycisphaerales bacterium]